MILKHKCLSALLFVYLHYNTNAGDLLAEKREAKHLINCQQIPLQYSHTRGKTSNNIVTVSTRYRSLCRIVEVLWNLWTS